MKAEKENPARGRNVLLARNATPCGGITMNTSTDTTPTLACGEHDARVSRADAGGRARSEATRLGTPEIKAHQQVSGTFFPTDSLVEGDDFDRILWDLQHAMWAVSQIKRLQGCGRWLAPGAGAASVEWGENFARFGQLQNSHSVWASPLASIRIAMLRAAMVGEALKNWCEKSPDHVVYFTTLTVRHASMHDINHVWDAVAKCWRGVTQGASWHGGARYIGDKKRFGIEHWVKSTEVTQGSNGWHVHIHACLLACKQSKEDITEELADRIFPRWARAAEKAGLKAPTRAHGIDVVEISATDARNRLAKYLTKSQFVGLGAETAGGALKEAKNGNRTPFQILADTLSDDPQTRARAIALWREWEQASSGRRQIAWSKGAKAALGVADLTDKELLELDESRKLDELRKLALIPATEWKKIRSDVDIRRHILHILKKAPTEKSARARLRQVLLELGIAFDEVPTTAGFESFSSTKSDESARSDSSSPAFPQKE